MTPRRKESVGEAELARHAAARRLWGLVAASAMSAEACGAAIAALDADADDGAVAPIGGPEAIGAVVGRVASASPAAKAALARHPDQPKRGPSRLSTEERRARLDARKALGAGILPAELVGKLFTAAKAGLSYSDQAVAAVIAAQCVMGSAPSP